MVGPSWVNSLGYLLCAAALWWRRRAPLRMIAFIAAVDIAQFLAIGASQGLGAFLPMLVGFYSMGRYAEPRELAIGAPLIVATMAVHEFRDPAFQFGGSAVSFYWRHGAGRSRPPGRRRDKTTPARPDRHGSSRREPGPRLGHPAARGCTVGPIQPGPGVGSAQHGDLMPQHQELGVLGGRRTTEQD